jgi:hypothetical protein
MDTRVHEAAGLRPVSDSTGDLGPSDGGLDLLSCSSVGRIQGVTTSVRPICPRKHLERLLACHASEEGSIPFVGAKGM